MPPVQPDGLNPWRGAQFADLRGRGLHHIGASEIVPASQAIQTEAFQRLPDLLHGHCRGVVGLGDTPLTQDFRRRRQHLPGRCDRFALGTRRCAHRGGRADSMMTDRVSAPWLSCRKAASSAPRIGASGVSPLAEEAASLTGRPPSQDRSPCSRTRRASSCTPAGCTSRGSRPPGSRSCRACAHAPTARAHRRTRAASR
jgi:hypothetical protein